MKQKENSSWLVAKKVINLNIYKSAVIFILSSENRALFILNICVNNNYGNCGNGTTATYEASLKFLSMKVVLCYMKNLICVFLCTR